MAEPVSCRCGECPNWFPVKNDFCLYCGWKVHFTVKITRCFETFMIFLRRVFSW